MLIKTVVQHHISVYSRLSNLLTHLFFKDNSVADIVVYVSLERSGGDAQSYDGWWWLFYCLSQLEKKCQNKCNGGENYFFNQEFSWVTETFTMMYSELIKNENLDIKQSENTGQCYLVSNNVDQNCTRLQIQTHTYTTHTQKNALYVSTLKCTHSHMRPTLRM